MRAILCQKIPSQPADLVVGEAPEPEPGPGQVVVRVRAAGLNFADTLLIAGRYQIKREPPFSPGMEVAGEVVAVGEGASRFAVGDRVMAVLDGGGFAERVAVAEGWVVRLPDGVDDVIAAGFPIAYGTSHLGLTYKAGLAAGETLLVNGAAGGVGLTAVEIGKRLGATVIATAGGPDKLAVAAEYGADHLIDSRAEDIRKRVKAITGGRGVDVVYDPVGGEVFDSSLRCTALGGRVLVVGFASGGVPQIPANVLLVKNITAIGYYWGQHREIAAEAMAASLDELVRWLAAGELRPHVSQTYALEDAPAALEALKDRRSTGKVVLQVA